MNALLPRDMFASWIGFEDIFNRIDRIASQTTKAISNWPPYNVKKLGDDKYMIEMAVAGFGKSDLELTLQGNELKVAGQVQTADDSDEYLHKGLAGRNFQRTLFLADNVVVKNADLVNGLLKIWLDYQLPEAQKARKIAIGEALNMFNPQLLTEEDKPKAKATKK